MIISWALIEAVDIISHKEILCSGEYKAARHPSLVPLASLAPTEAWFAAATRYF